MSMDRGRIFAVFLVAMMIPLSGCVSDGVDGEQGEQGLQGPPGTNGTDGNDGIDGSHGTDGTDGQNGTDGQDGTCLLYTSPSPRDRQKSRMPSSA